MKIATIARFGQFIIDLIFPPSPVVLKLKTIDAEGLELMLEKARELPDDSLALFAYSDESVKNLVWEIKYYRNTKIAEEVGLLLANKIKGKIKWSGKILLIPIPMTKKRLRERGFHHTEFLCKSIKKFLPENFEIRTDILEKIKNTPNQSSLENRMDRLENLKNCFKANSLVKDQSVILVDDVITTGATMNEAKRVLLEAGVKEVFCVAVAH